MEGTGGKVKGLSSLELKALSVPFALRFLLGVECDVVLCVTEVGNRRPFSIRFPSLSNAFKELLQLCALRYDLSCEHYDDHSLFTGILKFPILRYIDYIPGALHMEEVLGCLGVESIRSPKRLGESLHEFVASFIDYKDYQPDAALDPLNNGLYLTLDYGLSTATHSHLVEIQFHRGWDVDAALREFEEFSRLTANDIRFIDENNRGRGGVLVMPSTQDASDLFERYEDEDSDDEGELLPFVLRPVAPMVPVPSVEDSTLRKHREQYWKEIETFWKRFPIWSNTVVVSNLYDGATLEDALRLFDGLAIAKATMVECDTPARRRKLYVTFETSAVARTALSSDSMSTKGKTLRVQVSPPFLNEERRGRVIETISSPTSSPSLRSKCYPTGLTGSPNCTTAEPEGVHNERKETEGRRRDAHAVSGKSRDSAPALVNTESKHNAYTTPKLKPKTPDVMCQSPSPVSSTMNANAREFVPSSAFHASTPTTSAYVSPVPLVCVSEVLLSPPAYSLHGSSVRQDVGLGGGPPPPPPPYTAPPPYGVAAVQTVGMFPSHVLPPPHQSA
ncbi:hypothetical protein, conserved [Trypanosoma brucei brucei TREU927]|uniref:RNA-binding protein n=1 Tax=Trypanosoma brucei brucei (strain 927/4 GUTat10.1) TaxID=185431 RepID=Q38DG9_TRYB2|nr:hypothetical protein, conserved [Trypanosoma brucei brucei TREU927]EAN77151.1 hypothetical protein, conserved [Trypanosoma brucei brucei TREU927]